MFQDIVQIFRDRIIGGNENTPFDFQLVPTCYRPGIIIPLLLFAFLIMIIHYLAFNNMGFKPNWTMFMNCLINNYDMSSFKELVGKEEGFSDFTQTGAGSEGKSIGPERRKGSESGGEGSEDVKKMDGKQGNSDSFINAYYQKFLLWIYTKRQGTTIQFVYPGA